MEKEISVLIFDILVFLVSVILELGLIYLSSKTYLKIKNFSVFKAFQFSLLLIGIAYLVKIEVFSGSVIILGIILGYFVFSYLLNRCGYSGRWFKALAIYFLGLIVSLIITIYSWGIVFGFLWFGAGLLSFIISLIV